MTGAGRPPLLLKSSRFLRPENLANLRASLEHADLRRSHVTVLDAGVEVYQLVGGVWYPLDAPPRPDRGKRYVVDGEPTGVLPFDSHGFEVLCVAPHQ